MKTEKIKEILKGVESEKTLRLFFNEDTTGVIYLKGMLHSQIITANSGTHAFIEAVALTHSWDGSSRAIDVVVTKQFDIDWFIDRLSQYLTNIQILQPKLAADKKQKKKR